MSGVIDFDSRVQGINHPLGGQRPKINVQRILSELVEQVYCLNCGRSGGYISASLPKGVESSYVIFICPDCESRVGPLPLPALHLKER
jgi:hypothetical protein